MDLLFFFFFWSLPIPITNIWLHSIFQQEQGSFSKDISNVMNNTVKYVTNCISVTIGFLTRLNAISQLLGLNNLKVRLWSITIMGQELQNFSRKQSNNVVFNGRIAVI